MKNKSYFPHVLALIAMFIWGGSYVWTNQVFQTLKPGTTILLRLVISSIFLTLCIIALGKRQKIEHKDIKWFFLATLFEPFLYFLGESYGLMRTSPIICSAIIATIPLVSPFAAFIFLREKVTIWNIVGLTVSFAGVILMLFNKEMQFSASLTGVLILFGAVISAVLYTVILKRLTLKYSSLTIVATQNTIGIIYFLPFALLAERHYIGSLAQVGNYIVPLLLLGILASSVAYVLFTYCVERIGMTRTTSYTNLIPIFTAIFSYFIIHEKITLLKVIGIAFVILGLILSQQQHKGKCQTS